MFVVTAEADRLFLFPAKDGLPMTLRKTAVFRTQGEAAAFLAEQDELGLTSNSKE